MWDVIVLLSDHCLSIYFLLSLDHCLDITEILLKFKRNYIEFSAIDACFCIKLLEVSPNLKSLEDSR